MSLTVIQGNAAHQLGALIAKALENNPVAATVVDEHAAHYSIHVAALSTMDESQREDFTAAVTSHARMGVQATANRRTDAARRQGATNE